MELLFTGFLFFFDFFDFFLGQDLAPWEFVGPRDPACEKPAEKVNISMTSDGDQGNENCEKMIDEQKRHPLSLSLGRPWLKIGHDAYYIALPLHSTAMRCLQ